MQPALNVQDTGLAALVRNEVSHSRLLRLHKQCFMAIMPSWTSLFVMGSWYSL